LIIDFSLEANGDCLFVLLFALVLVDLTPQSAI
jgi:hypothetical protein